MRKGRTDNYGFVRSLLHWHWSPSVDFLLQWLEVNTEAMVVLEHDTLYPSHPAVSAPQWGYCGSGKSPTRCSSSPGTDGRASDEDKQIVIRVIMANVASFPKAGHKVCAMLCLTCPEWALMDLLPVKTEGQNVLHCCAGLTVILYRALNINKAFMAQCKKICECISHFTFLFHWLCLSLSSY